MEYIWKNSHNKKKETVNKKLQQLKQKLSHEKSQRKSSMEFIDNDKGPLELV